MASKLYGVNATIIILVFVFYCIVFFVFMIIKNRFFFIVFIRSSLTYAGNVTKTRQIVELEVLSISFCCEWIDLKTDIFIGATRFEKQLENNHLSSVLQRLAHTLESIEFNV